VATPEPSPEATPVLSASPTPSPTPSPTVAPAQLTATYASIQSLVFDQKCVICHSPTSTDPDAANEALDSYAGIMAAGNKLLVAGDGVNSKIITKIVAGKMPPANSGIPAVTADELAAIKTWIMNGATP
jgi:mono/diheme cytochrome c family protein